MTKKITIIPGTDYTLQALVDMLNNEYTQKKSGVQFTKSDVYQYIKRGKLPDSYGGNKLKVIKNKSVGIKIIRIVKKK